MYVIPQTKVLFLGEIGQFGGILGNHQRKSSWKMHEEQFEDENDPAMTLMQPCSTRGLLCPLAWEALCCHTLSSPRVSPNLTFLLSCLWWGSRFIFSAPLFLANNLPFLQSCFYPASLLNMVVLLWWLHFFFSSKHSLLQPLLFHKSLPLPTPFFTISQYAAGFIISEGCRSLGGGFDFKIQT